MSNGLIWLSDIADVTDYLYLKWEHVPIKNWGALSLFVLDMLSIEKKLQIFATSAREGSLSLFIDLLGTIRSKH